MDIKRVSHVDELPAVYAVYKHLRPHLTYAGFRAQVERQQSQFFQLAVVEDAGNTVAAAGYRYAEFLAWGKVLYVDDLVTLPHATGKGYGGALLDWLIEKARETGCDAVHLDTGYARHDAHRLYLRKGFRMTCHHMELAL